MIYILIDLNGILIRYAAAMQNNEIWDQQYGGMLAVFRLMKMLLQKYNNACIVVFSDKCRNNFRRKICADYKKTRDSSKLNINIIHQLNNIDTYIAKAGITHIYHDECEADDLMASFAHQNPDHSHIIVSSDKDMFQLVCDYICIYNPFERRIIDVAYVIEKTQIHPNHFALFQALMGDAGDSIRGVKNVGKVTARKILSRTTCVIEMQSIYDYDFSTLAKDLQLTTLRRNIELITPSNIPTNVQLINKQIEDILACETIASATPEVIA